MFELAPWKPFGEVRSLRREMDKLWEDFFGGGELVAPESGWLPAVDISETKDAIKVKAELPGMEPKDVEISLTGDILTIKGEKKQKTESKDENYHRIETRYGSFSRAIRLPVAVQADKIEASYEKGVLSIVLPKKEEVKPKQIEVKVK